MKWRVRCWVRITFKPMCVYVYKVSNREVSDARPSLWRAGTRRLVYLWSSRSLHQYVSHVEIDYLSSLLPGLTFFTFKSPHSQAHPPLQSGVSRDDQINTESNAHRRAALTFCVTVTQVPLADDVLLWISRPLEFVHKVYSSSKKNLLIFIKIFCDINCEEIWCLNPITIPKFRGRKKSPNFALCFIFFI